MTPLNCNLCGAPLGEKIYDSGEAKSLSSLCTVHERRTQVFVCGSCSQVQSGAFDDIDIYYESGYDFLVDSEEEDQIYEVVDERKIYRTEHQVRVLRHKLELEHGTRILDYGCAKSATMRDLSVQVPGIEISLFDVSDRYRPFWDKFIPRERGASHELPVSWSGYFDVVTSFFSLEHIAKPSDALAKILSLLRVGGILHGIVPNVLTNTADLIVVDHVNHFTDVSLAFLLQASGFEVVDIDSVSHRGAIVFNARKPAKHLSDQTIDKEKVQTTLDLVRAIAKFWQEAGSRIQAFEESLSPEAECALYGAGFYGAFIASWLRQPQRIRYVIDQNAFLQGKVIHGAPVIAPTALPSDVDTLFVGLNPSHAKFIIDNTPALAGRAVNRFYL